MAALLLQAQMMFPEGHGRPRALPKDHPQAPLINALLVNVKEAIEELWKQRSYAPMKKDEIKSRLGYRLDREEATGYVLAAAIGKPMLSPKEARAIGNRIGNSLGEKGALGKELREHKKRGTSSEQLLLAAATLNLSPPSRAAAQSTVPAAEDADEAAAEPSPSPAAASVPASFAFTFAAPVAPTPCRRRTQRQQHQHRLGGCSAPGRLPRRSTPAGSSSTIGMSTARLCNASFRTRAMRWHVRTSTSPPVTSRPLRRSTQRASAS